MSNKTEEQADVCDWLKGLGFDIVETVYGHTHVMEVAEDPPHLTNGKSYWQLSDNQAKRMRQLFTKQKEEWEKEYSWDAWPLGWDSENEEHHKRQLVLIRGGKIVDQEIVVDGEFCRCEPYRHGWPTLNTCIETWAKNRIAHLSSNEQVSPNDTPR